MANNMSLRQICHATRYVVAQGLCWLFWCLKYAVILPLATMALLALLVLWKDNTTPGKLLVQEIEFVRGRTPAGLYPVRYCSNSFGSDLAMPPSVTCGFRQLFTALWATLALMYVSLAVISGKYPMRPGKMKCVRVATADEHLKEVLTEDASLPEKIRKCHVYFPDDRTNRSNGDKNEHA